MIPSQCWKDSGPKDKNSWHWWFRLAQESPLHRREKWDKVFVGLGCSGVAGAKHMVLWCQDPREFWVWYPSKNWVQCANYEIYVYEVPLRHPSMSPCLHGPGRTAPTLPGSSRRSCETVQWTKNQLLIKKEVKDMGVEPKIGCLPPKMDGENNGSKPYEQMDDLGGKTHHFWRATHITKCLVHHNSTGGCPKAPAARSLGLPFSWALYSVYICLHNISLVVFGTLVMAWL